MHDGNGPAAARGPETDRQTETATGREAHTAATHRNGRVAASFMPVCQSGACRGRCRRDAGCGALLRSGPQGYGRSRERVNALKSPFAARRTIFAAQGRDSPAGHTCGAYGRKKGGQRKTAARLFGTRQGSKAPCRNGPTRDLLPGTGKVNAARRRARRGCACT